TSAPAIEKVKLARLGEAYTEEGPRRPTVKGLPGRLRLVGLCQAARNTGELSEEMADRVLDWIKPGLAEVAACDYPRVCVWPPNYSAEGFAITVASHVLFPEPRGERSRWVLVTGRVKMGRALIHVCLGLYADEKNTLRQVKVRGERWQGVVGIQPVRQPVGAR